MKMDFIQPKFKDIETLYDKKTGSSIKVGFITVKLKGYGTSTPKYEILYWEKEKESNGIFHGNQEWALTCNKPSVKEIHNRAKIELKNIDMSIGGDIIQIDAPKFDVDDVLYLKEYTRSFQVTDITIETKYKNRKITTEIHYWCGGNGYPEKAVSKEPKKKKRILSGKKLSVVFEGDTYTATID